MAFQKRVCRWCKQEFELHPGKPGFVDECPEHSDHEEVLEYPAATQSRYEDGTGFQITTRAQLDRMNALRKNTEEK